MIRSVLIGVLLALFVPTLGHAADRVNIPKQAELSMLVTGMVLVEPDGSVAGWEIDSSDELPDFVVGLIERSASAWRFEPVLIDGLPRKARARMNLRIVANKQEDDNYRIEIRSGHFGKDALPSEERREVEGDSVLRVAERGPIHYPERSARAGVHGTVYVLVKVGRDGSVVDAFAEQVNLGTFSAESAMRVMRNTLANAAVHGVKRWRYLPPSSGELADRESWTGRITVDFMLDGSPKPRYGQWQAYIPGPRHQAPWRGVDLEAHESPDTVGNSNGFRLVGQGLKLLTPLQSG